jgi:hypothetical protein
MLLDQGAQSSFSGVLAPWPPADCVYSCSISFSISFVRASISRTGRQLSVDKNCRHRGNDEGDAPLLLEADGAAGEGDVVIRGKEGDQAEDQAAAGLDGTEVIEPRPGAVCCR